MNNNIVTLAKREFWEHRALWLVPVGAAIFFILSAMFSGPNFTNRHMDFQIGSGVDSQTVRNIGSMSLLVFTGFLGVFSALAVFPYLLDCLFAERKDRSILFWKSLPVSDLQTVTAKLVVALVLVPALVLLLALVLQPLVAVIAWVRFPELRALFGSYLSGLAAVPHVLVAAVFGLLWYLPLATYLMLASVLAKRAPLMYAVLPPLVLSIAERVVWDTAYVNRFIGERVFPWPSRVDHLFVDADHGMKALGGDVWMLFLDPKLWLGLVAAAGMMYIVVRLRRYRDET